MQLGHLSRGMATMLDDVAAVAQTAGQPPARSPNTKAAIAYLIASGATAISVIETEAGCAFRIGSKIDPRAVSAQWLPEANARAVMLKARRVAGARPDGSKAARALAQAAADQRVTLTPHDVAMTRAANAAARIEEYIDSLHASGAMRTFTKTYKVMRLAAKQRGEGFMSYAAAELRLRRALVPLLIGGQGVGSVRSLFAEVFRTA
jgi:hypothetical protein